MNVTPTGETCNCTFTKMKYLIIKISLGFHRTIILDYVCK